MGDWGLNPCQPCKVNCPLCCPIAWALASTFIQHSAPGAWGQRGWEGISVFLTLIAVEMSPEHPPISSHRWELEEGGAELAQVTRRSLY